MFLASLTLSCSGAEDGMDKRDISEVHNYTLDDFGVSVIWTTYKFTDRISVSGTFEDYTLNKENLSGSIEDILNRLYLSIPTESMATTNAIQDFKIKTYFFKSFNTPFITGTVLNATDGKGNIKLKMNNISINTPYTYSLENDTIVLFTHLNLKKWKAENAMAALNEESSELQVGNDGLSKIWPEVDVVIRFPVYRLAK